MKKKIFLNKLAKILNKKQINKDDDLQFDSLSILDLMELNDSNFKGLKIPISKLKKCDSVKKLISIYGSKLF